ncbi:MAG: Cytochrome c family protein [uncultured Thiotrichaceae bacterium]|uniref:Cytochrome c family protein n=1 Tax=uncultured Thiotrichaceae bacterium TaxID=298394 RepID=A0A6S6UKT5_9GAMM|nr:MAG: Cytochrome c family protein [uncultured Thiotrichaceae bacterium]
MKKTTLAICMALVLSACSKDESQTEASTASATKETEAKTVESAMPPAATKPHAAASASDKEALIAEAKGAVMALGGSLKKELQGAMMSGGPVAALDVCVEKAPAITKQISEEKNLEIGRVSLKNRNSGNAANEWQTAVLNDFETRKAGGEDAGKLAYAETVDIDGKKEFRFMKAIPTGNLCLTCHGDIVPENVVAKLKEHYPEDKATGFKEGDLRGAFYVVKPL